jgi:UDP-N-acetylmuramoyl-L-alanyl-D-glutamate--2,6-diaminopimelate ligase
MEASSHALAQQRLAGLRVHTGVFTNLSRDHLDYHGDMRAYARAKARLFAMPGLAAAVINADDAAAGEMRAALAGATRMVDFSLAPDACTPVRARVLRNDAAGVELDIRGEHGDARIASALLGLPTAWNLLTAWCVLLLHGVDGARAAALLSRASAVPGRMQALGGGAAPLVVVDYAHTPAALAAALDALRPLCRARLWCVFGAGGERDSGKRPLMGEAAALRADQVVITDDNPRGEDGDAIVAQILGGVPVARRPHVQVERARARAIELAIGAAAAGDVILVAGKGHERYQDLCARRVPFSDLAVARAALEGARR